jgi:L-ascorbate metabolism protein UlaG (beta-lactamase superfamily)
MKITKYGHCCLRIEEKGVSIMTDPGNCSTLQDEARGIHIILITHEHPDHLHIESLKKVLANNPKARVITNIPVGALLAKENISYEIVEHGQHIEIGSIKIEGHGEKHAVIHPDWPGVKNTGYFIAERLFYPGDAFYDPQKPIDILALPVAGPWMKIQEAIDYAISQKPKYAFPVHDGIYKNSAIVHRPCAAILPKHGINFLVIEEGKTVEL